MTPITITLPPREFPIPAITNPEALILGRVPQPARCGFGLDIGNGLVIPEIKFTQPAMLVEQSTWPRVRAIYGEIIDRLQEELERRPLSADELQSQVEREYGK